MRVGVVGRTPVELRDALASGARGAEAEIKSRSYATLASGERALRAGDVGVLVVGGTRLVWKSEPDDRLRAVAGGAVQRLEWRRRAAAAGLTAAEADALLAPQPLSERRLEPTDPEKDARYAAALLGVFPLTIVLSLYGGAVANGVAQEKTGRVVEVLLSRVSARELLTGKVAGIGLVGLGQLLLALIASLAAALSFERIELPSAVPAVLGWVILWFVLGYAFYSVLYAAVGALVSRTEDVESVKAPLGWLIVACMFLAIAAVEAPDAWWVRLASFVPFTAPFVQPVRAAVGDVAVWEVLLAAAITLAATSAVIRVAAAVYAGAVLRSGPRLRAKDVLAAAQAARTGAS
jgi:ABC-2 type transport system permease protein